MVTIEILLEDNILADDPRAVSVLMGELSGKSFDLSHEDLVGMADDVTMVVARSEDTHKTIVGIGCIVSMNLPQGYRHLIESLVILPEYRGQKLGEKIMTALIDAAKTYGEGNINLTCNATRESALRLYKDMGFKKSDTAVYRLCL